MYLIFSCTSFLFKYCTCLSQEHKFTSSKLFIECEMVPYLQMSWKKPPNMISDLSAIIPLTLLYQFFFSDSKLIFLSLQLNLPVLKVFVILYQHLFKNDLSVRAPGIQIKYYIQYEYEYCMCTMFVCVTSQMRSCWQKLGLPDACTVRMVRTLSPGARWPLSGRIFTVYVENRKQVDIRLNSINTYLNKYCM